MKKNIGTFDRVMRAIAGIVCVLLAVFVVTSLPAKIILGIVALFCFYQALMSWCLLYQIMGKNTCPAE
jgi:hypothetical protein